MTFKRIIFSLCLKNVFIGKDCFIEAFLTFKAHILFITSCVHFISPRLNKVVIFCQNLWMAEDIALY